MRFLVINTDYARFIDQHYASHPHLAETPYQEQMAARMDTAFGLADFLSRNLRRLGHQADDIIANHPHLQARWAHEHDRSTLVQSGPRWQMRRRRGVPWPTRRPDDRWLLRVLEAQVRHYQPDVLYCLALETVGSDFLRAVKGSYGIAVGQHAAPLPVLDVSEYDLILSSLPNQVRYFQQQGVRAEYFRLGFEETLVQRLQGIEKAHDVAFVGGLAGPHHTGLPVLDLLARSLNLAVWGYGVERLRPDSAIRRGYRGQLWGLDMYRVLAASRVCLNRHIDSADRYANNLRLYEVTGAGSLLLTDARDNLADLFAPGTEVAVYQSPQECLQLAQHYLANPGEARSIASKGQARTLAQHTWYHRMQELQDILKKYL